MRRYLRRFKDRLLPTYIHELLKPASGAAGPWDEAAYQLQQLRGQGTGYPHYLYGMLTAARTARAIGKTHMTVIEFGVAGGNGLVAMEKHAQIIEKQFGISVDVVGFDMSTGLPPATDPRDCPFAFQEGALSMDIEKLQSRLNKASLRIGDVTDTIHSFKAEDFAPIGFVSVDLDFYTSTRDSLELFKVEACRMLPRVSMYFDDLTGYPYTTVTGEWAAINEFNQRTQHREIGQIYGLKYWVGRHYRFSGWTEKFFWLHVYDHADYNTREKTGMPERPLR
jgi:hypothetical protein